MYGIRSRALTAEDISILNNNGTLNLEYSVTEKTVPGKIRLPDIEVELDGKVTPSPWWGTTQPAIFTSTQSVYTPTIQEAGFDNLDAKILSKMLFPSGYNSSTEQFIKVLLANRSRLVDVGKGPTDSGVSFGVTRLELRFGSYKFISASTQKEYLYYTAASEINKDEGAPGKNQVAGSHVISLIWFPKDTCDMRYDSYRENFEVTSAVGKNIKHGKYGYSKYFEDLPKQT